MRLGVGGHDMMDESWKKGTKSRKEGRVMGLKVENEDGVGQVLCEIFLLVNHPPRAVGRWEVPGCVSV